MESIFKISMHWSITFTFLLYINVVLMTEKPFKLNIVTYNTWSNLFAHDYNETDSIFF